MSTRAPRTHNIGTPLCGKKWPNSRCRFPLAASSPVLVGRQASPARLNGSLRLGYHIALNDEVIRPWPEPAKNWDHRARKRTGTSPHLFVNGWGQGEPECFLGRRLPVPGAADRPRVRCGGYEMSRTDADPNAQAEGSSEPGSTSTEPAWLFGLPAEAASAQAGWKTVNRIQVGTRRSRRNKAD